MKDEKALPGGRSVAPACAPATPRSVALLRVDEFPWRIIMGITARYTQTHTYRDIRIHTVRGPGAPMLFVVAAVNDYGNEVETIAVALT